MEPLSTPRTRPLLQYDAARRRLWVLGQRCHHGASGALIVSAAAAALALHTMAMPAVSALMATGTALMLHDRHDLSLWFQPGWQNQP